MANKIALPSNVEAERSVLGAMLMSEDASAIALASLTEESFSDTDPRNKLVFRAIKVLGDRNSAIDPQTVNDELTLMKLNKDAGSPDYLMDLVNTSINANNVDHYVNIVRDQAVLRDYLLKMEDIKKDYAQGAVTDIGDFITVSTQSLDDIASRRSIGGFKEAKVVGEMVSKQIAMEKNRSNKRLTGVDTGFDLLNKYTHGWQKGSLVIIAARPSVGKTAFAINLMYNAAVHEKRPVAFFSCEMPSDQIVKRLCAAVALVNLESIQTGDFFGNDNVKVSSALQQIESTQIYFDDTANQLLGDIIAKSRKLQAAHPDLACIFIDYLNLISVEAKFDSRSLEVSLITKSLKELARSLNIPVIALAQLNRDVDKTDSKVPMLSNLRESGSIEQDADMVLLMSRSDYYSNLGQNMKQKTGAAHEFSNNLQTQVNTAKAAGKDQGAVSVVNIELAKNRNGRTGPITLLFSKNYQRFDNPSPELVEETSKINGSVNLDDDIG